MGNGMSMNQDKHWRKNHDRFPRFLLKAFLSVFVAGVMFYGLVLLGLILPPTRCFAQQVLGFNLFYSVGLPVSAIGAAGIVGVFWWLFGPQSNVHTPVDEKSGERTEKPISIKVFGLEFSGPAGPITLWLACFLALVGSMVLVSGVNERVFGELSKDHLATLWFNDSCHSSTKNDSESPTIATP
jgi:hypothetical protein